MNNTFHPPVITLQYKVFYLFISTIGILGNSAIVYVTFRSRNRKLRSVCNIFIALVSAGDVLHHIGQYLMIATHDLSVTHFITNKDCAMLQFLPLFGICFSSFLLLNVAIDRLAAITIFYRKFEGHHKLYLLIQILPATLFATTISSLTLVQRSSEKQVFCIVTQAMHRDLDRICFFVINTVSIIIILCYVIFLILIRKSGIADKSIRNVCRSVLLVSVTVAFGWFGTSAIIVGYHLLPIDVTIEKLELTAGLFVNTACASNFFFYYFVSSDYRYTFNEHFRLDSIIRIAKTNFVKDTYPSRVLVTISTMPAKEQVETAIRGL